MEEDDFDIIINVNGIKKDPNPYGRDPNPEPCEWVKRLDARIEKYLSDICRFFHNICASKDFKKLKHLWGMVFRALVIGSSGFILYYWIDAKPIADVPFIRLTLNDIFDSLFCVAVNICFVVWFFNFPHKNINDPENDPYDIWAYGGGFTALVTLSIYIYLKNSQFVSDILEIYLTLLGFGACLWFVYFVLIKVNIRLAFSPSQDFKILLNCFSRGYTQTSLMGTLTFPAGPSFPRPLVFPHNCQLAAL